MSCGDKSQHFALMLTRYGGNLVDIAHANILVRTPHNTRRKNLDLSPANAYLAVVADPKNRAMNPGVAR